MPKEKGIEQVLNFDQGNIEILPPEILTEILSFAETRDIRNILLTSGLWKHILENDKVRWKKLIDEYFPWLSTLRATEYEERPHQLFTTILDNLLNKNPSDNVFSFRKEKFTFLDATALFGDLTEAGKTPQYKKFFLSGLKGKIDDIENDKELTENDRNSLLSLAAACGHKVEFRKIQKFKYEILFYACCIGNIDKVKNLLTEITFSSENINNALHLSFITGNVDIAEHIFISTSQHKKSYASTSIILAIQYGAISFLTKVLAEYKELFLRNGDFDKDFLTTARNFEQTEIAKLFIDEFKITDEDFINDSAPLPLTQQFEAFKNQDNAMINRPKEESLDSPESLQPPKSP